MATKNKTVRLPMFDEEGVELPGYYLEIDIDYFISSTRGLRSSQARIVEPPTVEFENKVAIESEFEPHFVNDEVEYISRVISGLPVEPIEWRIIPGFERYEMNREKKVQDTLSGGQKIPLYEDGIRPKIHLYNGRYVKLLSLDRLFEITFPELKP